LVAQRFQRCDKTFLFGEGFSPRGPFALSFQLGKAMPFQSEFKSTKYPANSVVAHFEFLMASSLVDGVIRSVAVLQAERRISATTLCATRDPSARW
jgi:hypothetical protein